MGIYFNPKNESFKKAVKSQIYIDKTGLLKELNMLIGTDNNCIALSHARRFGKTQAAAMIDAYYGCGNDSKNIFATFEISRDAKYEEHLNKYNVLHIDIASISDFHKDDLIDEFIRRIYSEFQTVFGNEFNSRVDINLALHWVYEKTGKFFVIILDEWDSVIRNFADKPTLIHQYLQLLHAIFKSEESKTYLALGYITGILPIKKLMDESALNNFQEYTMLKSGRFTKYFGFTENEVKILCENYKMDFDSVKEWYDGYLISGLHMYNPNSVCQSLIDGELDSYWKNTSAFDTINKFITLNYDGLKQSVLSMLAGNKVPVNINTFRNDLLVIGSKDDALTALIHLGYLAYNAETYEAYIPNFEVSLAYQAALQSSSWKEIASTISNCNALLQATISKDEDKVAALIEEAHSAYTSIIKYNDENSLSCVITMAYFTAPAFYNICRELPTGKGFADFAFIPRGDAPNKPALIIELKFNKSADSAIKQIKEKRYTGMLKGYSGKILLVGINYDKFSSDKRHTCKIEEWQ